MSYQLAITHKGTYLHAVVNGCNTRENVAGYIRELLEECASRNCFRVLIEERLEGPRLGTLEVLEIVEEASGSARGTLKAVAYVDVNASGDSMRFVETVALNRGLRVTAFSFVADAERWLFEDCRAERE